VFSPNTVETSTRKASLEIGSGIAPIQPPSPPHEASSHLRHLLIGLGRLPNLVEHQHLMTVAGRLR